MGLNSTEYLGMTLGIDDADSVNKEYFAYCAKNEYRFQACTACELMRYPPTTSCPWCSCRDTYWKATSGFGSIYSFTVVQHAIQPAFKNYLPYVVVLVELDEQRNTPEHGVSLRIIGNLVNENGELKKYVDGESWGIGSKVRLHFHSVSEAISLPQWMLVLDE